MKASECHKLASIQLTGIPPKPKGQEEISVTYAIDENGLLKVTATSTSNSNIVVNLAILQDKLNLNDSELLRLTQVARDEEAESIAKKQKDQEAYNIQVEESKDLLPESLQDLFRAIRFTC